MISSISLFSFKASAFLSCLRTPFSPRVWRYCVCYVLFVLPITFKSVIHLGLTFKCSMKYGSNFASFCNWYLIVWHHLLKNCIAPIIRYLALILCLQCQCLLLSSPCLLGICLMSIIHCLNYNSFIIDLGYKNNSFFKSILAFLYIHKNVKHVSSTKLLVLIRIALNLQIILGETDIDTKPWILNHDFGISIYLGFL